MTNQKIEFGRLRELTDLSSMAEASQEGTVLLLDPAQVVTKKQVRRKFRNIEELAESMKVEQQSPIIVSPLNKDTNTYMLQKGERRLRAALLIGGDFKIKAIVDAAVRSESQKTASQLIENVQRDDLSVLEVADALLDLREKLRAEGQKGTGRELAEALKKPESWVSKHLDLAEVPPELAALVDDEITSDAELIQSLRKICDLDRDLYLQLVEKARSDGGLSRSEARERLKQLRNAMQQKGQGAAKPIQQSGQQAGSPGLGTANPDDSKGQGGGPVGDGLATSEPASEPGSGATSTSPSAAAQGSTHQTTDPVPPTAQGDAKSSGFAQPSATQKHDGRKKLGKTEIAEIDPREMVIQVRLSLDKKVVVGELKLDRICGSTGKGVVTYLDGGKQRDDLVNLDQVEIISMVRLAREDQDE